MSTTREVLKSNRLKRPSVSGSWLPTLDPVGLVVRSGRSRMRGSFEHQDNIIVDL